MFATLYQLSLRAPLPEFERKEVNVTTRPHIPIVSDLLIRRVGKQTETPDVRAGLWGIRASGDVQGAVRPD